MANQRIGRRHVLMGGSAVIASELLPCCGSLAHAGLSTGKPLVSVRIFSFPGLFNLLIRAGQEKKFFQAEGLEVSHAFTHTSRELIEKLSAGQYDIATSSIDNIIAYNSGQGQVALPRKAGFFGFMNINKNMTLPLIVQPDIRSFEDLRGKLLAVDAISTGFSFVLRKILEQRGLGRTDYELVSVGNAPKRLESLKADLCAGAILTPPFNRLAEASGLHQLGSSQDIADNYQGTCFISTRRWAEENPQHLKSFIRAILTVENWLSEPSHHHEAGQILRRHNKSVTQAGVLESLCLILIYLTRIIFGHD